MIWDIISTQTSLQSLSEKLIAVIFNFFFIHFPSFITADSYLNFIYFSQMEMVKLNTLNLLNGGKNLTALQALV